MQTHFSDADRQKPHIQQADEVLRACVHCGFCNATCPTYLLLGDERDGPRGRIYLMKELLESADDDTQAAEKAQTHLDRCLTCLNCETTCPSGVEYGKLLNIGRAEVQRRAPRSVSKRLSDYGLRKMLVNPARFKALLRLGQTFTPLVPGKLRNKMPAAPVDAGSRPAEDRHARRVLLLEGCVQPGLSPNTNAATARVLDRLGISVTPVAEAGCCGAIDFHLSAQEQARERMRANIDAWWPYVEQGAEAIVQTASGCGAFVKEYGEMLKDDPDYATRAKTISSMARDIVEVLRKAPLDKLDVRSDQRLAFQCPCTLQHAQQLGGAVEDVLQKLGFALTPVQNGHLCCGSAGTYSITQPELATQLRDNKLDALEAGHPDVVVTANIGCQTHLAGAGRTPVRHWIEVVDDTLV
ncbi:glycolate oxidase subunit GlcF [Halomonas cibimaris]|uniref:Glycolate oxidase iron-sulfur subunit n=1 Tax=Halomonas cibimaris TaxID=657012 RepID=A0ABP7LUV4_9GAMM